MARLTPLSKFLITVLVLGAVGTAVYKNRGMFEQGAGAGRRRRAPGARQPRRRRAAGRRAARAR